MENGIPEILAAWQQLGKNHPWAGNSTKPLTMRLKRVAHLMTLQMEQELGISLPQVRILFEAYYNPRISQAALHKSYQIDPASITRTVQNMERDGLIVRSLDPKDNRLMLIELTPKGQAIVEDLPKRIVDYENRLTSQMDDAEIHQLHSLLEKLEESLLSVATKADLEN